MLKKFAIFVIEKSDFLEFERALLHRKDATSLKKSRKLPDMFPVTIWSVFGQLILWSSRLETDFISKITNFLSTDNKVEGSYT